MKKIAIILEDGFEETEAIVPHDVLNRAGCEVDFVSTHADSATSTVGIRIATKKVTNFADYDAIVLPGGMPGARNLASNQTVIATVKDFANNGKIVAAICAAPALALSAAGVLDGKSFTCYPGMENNVSGGHYTGANVTVDGNIITSAGPATALDFGLTIANALGLDATQVSTGMLWTRYSK